MIKDGKNYCNFCGREEATLENNSFFSSADKQTHICKHCIDILTALSSEIDDLFIEEVQEEKEEEEFKLIPPNEIKKYLDDYIISQDEAKKIIATAIYNHYKMIHGERIDEDVELKKSNILMVGPTGVGF